MRYFRLGHLNKIFVKVGDRVRVGQKIATNGTGNGRWLAHCHFDGFKKKPDNWIMYNVGWTKEETEELFIETTPYRKIVMPNFHHYGWQWLEWTGSVFHPGVDLNGPGAGNADFDDPLHSPCEGIIEYVYEGSGSNGGWGRLIGIKEDKMSEKNHEVKEIMEAAKKYLDIDAGTRINKREDKEIADAIKDLAEKDSKPKIIYKDTPETTNEINTLHKMRNEIQDSINNSKK